MQSILNNPKYGPKTELGTNMHTYLKFGLPRVLATRGGGGGSSGITPVHKGTDILKKKNTFLCDLGIKLMFKIQKQIQKTVIQKRILIFWPITKRLYNLDLQSCVVIGRKVEGFKMFGQLFF